MYLVPACVTNVVLFILLSEEIKQSDMKILRGPLRRPHNDLMLQVYEISLDDAYTL